MAEHLPYQWLNGLSNWIIAIAYISIALTLTYLIRKRSDLPFRTIFWLFAGLILSCGLMRLIAIWAIWHPAYWYSLSGIARAGTAMAALIGAAILYVLVPEALKLRSPSQLEVELLQLGSIVASSNDPIIRKDLNGTIQSWNHAAELLYGYTEMEVKGKSISLLVPPDRTNEVRAVLESVAKGIGVSAYETQRVTKDGRLVDVALSVSPVYESGRIVGAATIVRDISERLRLMKAARQYTERLEILHRLDRMILNREPLRECARLAIEFINSLTSFSRITVSEPRFEINKFVEIIGYSNGEFSEAKEHSWAPFTAIAEPLSRGTILINELALYGDLPELEAFNNAGTRYVCIVPMIAHEELIGSVNLGVVDRAVLTQEILDCARELSNQIAVSIQQTRLWERIDRDSADLERKVAERTKELAEANAALDTFSYSVSHDLRAPLRTLQGFTEALLEDHSAQLDAVGQDFARRVAQAARRLDRLIQDLLKYSRVSQNKISFESVNLHSVLQEILVDLGADLVQNKVDVTIEEPLFEVLGHRATLSQILANLISNAVKFVSPERNAAIRVRAEDSGNGVVRLWIEDNGIGIDPKHQDRIFQIFERLHTNYPGTGTGLAIVRRGVERMGGNVGVVSQLGCGSRFWVDLPKPETV